MWQHAILHVGNPALGAAIVPGQRLLRRGSDTYSIQSLEGCRRQMETILQGMASFSSGCAPHQIELSRVAISAWGARAFLNAGLGGSCL